ncbi:hypothetical protein JYU34_012140 [Plutella xylostella]|uniref:Large ribosomal subunit protein mL44 n=1 Tax=Plutella xylostella TaxID=51655 RepID=A0ABQ7QEK5_PLUXY|nr:hypothetical protein JYU34_012140 [Plutella xylostella]
MALIRRFIPLFTKSIRIAPVNSQARKIHRYVAPTLMELKRREEKNGGKVTNPRNTFLEWNLEAELFAFGKRLNEDFDPDLLLQAFTDRSYVIKEELKQKELNIDIKMKDNKKLAEEGESFMRQYIQRYLEHVLPRFPLEGVAGVHRHLLSEATLAHVALHLGTKDIILASEYPVDNYILANTFKALVGALMKSSGEEQAAHFVRDFLITQLNGADVNEYFHIEDPWALLTDLLHKRGAAVEPRLIAETGGNTVLACYRVGLYVDKQMVASGYGESVPVAKEMAAREALKKIFGTEDHAPPIDFTVQGVPQGAAEREKISSS